MQYSHNCNFYPINAGLTISLAILSIAIEVGFIVIRLLSMRLVNMKIIIFLLVVSYLYTSNQTPTVALIFIEGCVLCSISRIRYPTTPYTIQGIPTFYPYSVGRGV